MDELVQEEGDFEWFFRNCKSFLFHQNALQNFLKVLSFKQTYMHLKFWLLFWHHIHHSNISSLLTWWSHGLTGSFFRSSCCNSNWLRETNSNTGFTQWNCHRYKLAMSRAYRGSGGRGLRCGCRRVWVKEELISSWQVGGRYGCLFGLSFVWFDLYSCNDWKKKS